MTRNTWEAVKAAIAKIREGASDELALESKAIYPAWKPETEYTAEKSRVLDGEGLYKCRQSHTSQAIYPPHLVPALWTLITLEPGTHDNPIHYGAGMELEEGLYYIEDGILYICFRSTGVPVYNPLSALVGIYVEVAE